MCQIYCRKAFSYGHTSYFVTILDAISASSANTPFRILFARSISSAQGAGCAAPLGAPVAHSDGIMVAVPHPRAMAVERHEPNRRCASNGCSFPGHTLANAPAVRRSGACLLTRQSIGTPWPVRDTRPGGVPSRGKSRATVALQARREYHVSIVRPLSGDRR